MKHKIHILTTLTAIALLSSCDVTEDGYKPIDQISDSPIPVILKDKTFTVGEVSFKMILVEGGTYLMGSDDEDAWDDEKPVHSETVGTFMIGETEVSQLLWETVMNSNPSNFKGGKLPVENISWSECQTFIQKLNSLTGGNFRLPTEAEWEYAARGGNLSKGYKYSGSDDIEDVAWYLDNSKSKTQEIGMKKANELGIYDMSGNVLEWISGYYNPNYETESNTSLHMHRGGCWNNTARACRVSDRYFYSESYGCANLGLRLALSYDANEEGYNPIDEPFSTDADPIMGEYAGKANISVMGTDCGEVNFDIKVALEDEHTVTVILPQCTFTPPIQNASEFTIPCIAVHEVKVTESNNVYKISVQEYKATIDGVSYTVDIDGTFVGNDADIRYVITPGRMPMPINFAFIGTRK